LLSCIDGSYWLILGTDTPEGLEWESPRRIYVDAKPFTGVWRVRPAIADWNGDGFLEMLTLNERGYLALYGRDPNGEPEELISLGQVPDESGTAFRIGGENRYSSHTSIGRAKLFAYDWDGDGLLELLVGAHCQTKLPLDLAALFKRGKGERGSATVMLINNIGTGEKPIWGESYAVVLKEGGLLDFGAHSCAPIIVDWDGNGTDTMVVGNEDGFIYAFDREELTLLKADIASPGNSEGGKAQ
jgi:hypothetical protein